MLSQYIIHTMNFILILHIYNKTGSAIAASLLWIAYAMPALVIGPFAAALVDLVDRRKVLIITNLAQAVSIFIFSFIYARYIFFSYAVVLVYSFFDQFYVPAEAASIPSVVKKELLAQANGLFFVTQQSAIIFGFVLAGFLNEYIGIEATFITCSILMMCAFLAVRQLPTMLGARGLSAVATFEKRFLHFFRKISEGYQFIRQKREVLIPFVFLMSLQVMISTLTIIVPSLAESILSTNPNAAGIIIVLPAGIGAGVGTFIVSRLLRLGIRKKSIIDKSLLIVMAGLLILDIFVPSTNTAFKAVLSFSVFFLVGAAGIGLLIPAQTFLQEVTPVYIRGRVFGNFWFLTTAATILPIMFSATLIDLVGVRWLIFSLAILLGIISILSIKFGSKAISGKSLW